MQRLYLLLSILVLTVLLAGCASRLAAQPEKVRALENATPTNLPEKTTRIATTTSEIVRRDHPANCPVTVPQEPLFTAPEPYSPNAPFDHNFWFGSENLWTMLPQDGVWFGLPNNPQGYTQKVFWWREGYVWREEPEPALLVTGERLDVSAPALMSSKATNAFAADIGSAMLVGVDFPTLGCWKITGKYADAELSFVVWVAP